MWKDSETSTSELDKEKAPAKSTYKVLKSCAHKKERLRAGDTVPASWPKDAIEFLLRKKAIVKEG